MLFHRPARPALVPVGPELLMIHFVEYSFSVRRGVFFFTWRFINIIARDISTRSQRLYYSHDFGSTVAATIAECDSR